MSRWHRICNRLGSIFEPCLESFGVDVGGKLAPYWRHFGCLGGLSGSSGFKHASWGCLGCMLGDLGVSWMRLGASWGCLREVLAQILERFGQKVGTFCRLFRIIVVRGNVFANSVLWTTQGGTVKWFQLLRSTSIPTGLCQREVVSYVLEDFR